MPERKLIFALVGTSLPLSDIAKLYPNTYSQARLNPHDAVSMHELLTLVRYATARSFRTVTMPTILSTYVHRNLHRRFNITLNRMAFVTRMQ